MTRVKTAPEWDYLRKVRVRLIRPEEQGRFDGLLESQHYLHSARVDGPSLRDVAEVDGQWVVPVVFSGPCPLRATHLGSHWEVFARFKDKRRGHGLRHRQPFVLACATAAMLMGAGGYEAFEEECA